MEAEMIQELSAEDLWGLDREVMTLEGEEVCRTVRRFAGATRAAIDQYRENNYDRADAAGAPRSRADAVAVTGILGALNMCATSMGLDLDGM